MTVTVTEQETIFIRNCVQGFVCIGEPKTTSSEDMFACVNENYLTNHKSKFVGFGCDGASNMMGCKIGLITRLQECYPEVVGVHCLCHHLERSFRTGKSLFRLTKFRKVSDQMTFFSRTLYH
jgi:hypothetical protein